MDGILLSARLLLAGVFLVAGVAKLADRDGAREATRAFGAPEARAAPASTLLIIAELLAGVMLIPTATAPAGAALGAVLLVSFCAGITRSMVRGEAPDCHCFGQLHSAPAGPKTLARNLVLAATSALVLIGGPGTSATAWLSTLSATGTVTLLAGVVLAVIAAAGGALALSLLRQHGRLLLRVDALEQALAEHGIALPDPNSQPEPEEGLPIGVPAPEFQLLDLRHRRVALETLTSSDRPLMLVFTDPGCGPCSALMPQIADWQREHSDALRIVLVSRGGRDANLARAAEHGITDVLIQRDREVSKRYEVAGTPSAVLIAPDGTIASPVHGGADAIKRLVDTQITPSVLAIHHHQPVPSGPAPDVPLRTLELEEVMLSSMLSGPTAVIFWNPSCGFCERMLPDLRALEQDLPADGPSLLLISAGDPEANRAMGLDAPILLDRAFVAGNAFGAAGTPSGVLVDADGQIASHVAVGADAVLALIGADSAIAARAA